MKYLRPVRPLEWAKRGDGASKRNLGDSGVGGVLRNCDGTYLGCFSMAIGRKWAFEAEVEAVLCVLKFCKEVNVKNMSIVSVSSIVVGWVKMSQWTVEAN